MFEFARCVRVCVCLTCVPVVSLCCDVVWFAVVFVVLVWVSVCVCLF